MRQLETSAQKEEFWRIVSDAHHRIVSEVFAQELMRRHLVVALPHV